MGDGADRSFTSPAVYIKLQLLLAACRASASPHSGPAMALCKLLILLVLLHNTGGETEHTMLVNIILC